MITWSRYIKTFLKKTEYDSFAGGLVVAKWFDTWYHEAESDNKWIQYGYIMTCKEACYAAHNRNASEA